LVVNSNTRTPWKWLELILTLWVLTISPTSESPFYIKRTCTVIHIMGHTYLIPLLGRLSIQELNCTHLSRSLSQMDFKSNSTLQNRLVRWGLHPTYILLKYLIYSRCVQIPTYNPNVEDCSIHAWYYIFQGGLIVAQ